jgi:hypothetical protein
MIINDASVEVRVPAQQRLPVRSVMTITNVGLKIP